MQKFMGHGHEQFLVHKCLLIVGVKGFWCKSFLVKHVSGVQGFSFKRLLVSAHKIHGPKIVLAHKISNARGVLCRKGCYHRDLV